MGWIPSLIGLGGGLLGKLFGGGPKFDDSALRDGLGKMDKLFGNYSGAEQSYEGSFRPLMDYFAAGGSATEANKQKAMSQVLAPINQMIPDARTRLQNDQARAGFYLPSTVTNAAQNDLGVKAAFSRSQAIGGVENEFRQLLDQNKALGMQAAGQQLSMLRQLLSQIAGQKGQLGAQMAGLSANREQAGSEWGGIFSSLLGGGIGSLFGDGGWFSRNDGGTGRK